MGAAMSRVLVTGGAGFMGSQLVRTLSASGWDVVVLDKLTYAGNRAFLEGVKHTFIEGDVCDPSAVAAAMADVDAVVHMAAESHVARSLHTPDHFLHTNIHGTRVMLDAALRAGIDRFIHISTDEVFGQAPHGVALVRRLPCAQGTPTPPQRSVPRRWCMRGDTHGYPAAIVRCTNTTGRVSTQRRRFPAGFVLA